jgi:hypothetical protein
MTMAWALTELLRRPDAAAAATEKLDRIVGPTGGGEAGDAGRIGGHRWHMGRGVQRPTSVIGSTEQRRRHGFPVASVGQPRR